MTARVSRSSGCRARRSSPARRDRPASIASARSESTAPRRSRRRRGSCRSAEPFEIRRATSRPGNSPSRRSFSRSASSVSRRLPTSFCRSSRSCWLTSAGRPLDLHALDDVAGVDVLDEIGVVTDPCDEEDDVRLAVGSRARCALAATTSGCSASMREASSPESLAIERRSDERVDVFLKSGAQVVERETRHLDGVDDRALGRVSFLGVGHQQRKAEEGEQQRKCSHVTTTGQAARHCTSS